MEIKYVSTNDELVLEREGNTVPCAVSLDLVAQTICITPTRTDMDVLGCTIVDVESALIYWEIPQIKASNANALLDHIAPLAEIIISQYSKNNCLETPFGTSSQNAINQISHYLNDLEFSEL